MIDKIEIATIKTIGARLREARELTRLSIQDAAELLGIQPEGLRRIETGVDVENIPLHLIRKATELYEVSVDFIYGLSGDEWERCPEARRERDFIGALRSEFYSEQAKIAAELIHQRNQIEALANTVTALTPAIRAVYNSILRFWELNQEFTDMPAGAPVINALDLAEKAADKAVRQLVRQGLLPFHDLLLYPIAEPEPIRKPAKDAASRAVVIHHNKINRRGENGSGIKAGIG